MPEESKVKILIDKLVERQRQIEAQQKAIKDAYTKNSDKVKAEVDALQGV